MQETRRSLRLPPINPQTASTSKLQTCSPHRVACGAISNTHTTAVGRVETRASATPRQGIYQLHRAGHTGQFQDWLQPPNAQLKPKRHNLQSAYEHPTVVSQYLMEECKHKHTLGPFSSPPLPSLQISSFSIIPKRQQHNKWCLILDLSSPDGCSVNDGIDSSTCSLDYISVDAIAAAVCQLGHSSLIAKSNIKRAYHQIPVHPPLLGMRWHDNWYIDCTLPFGLQSTPLIFSVVVDALEWIVSQRC